MEGLAQCVQHTIEFGSITDHGDMVVEKGIVITYHSGANNVKVNVKWQGVVWVAVLPFLLYMALRPKTMEGMGWNMGKNGLNWERNDE